MAKSNIAQTARALGISRTTLYEYMKAGEVSYETIGAANGKKGKRVFDESEVGRFRTVLEERGKVSSERPSKRSDGHEKTPQNAQIEQVLREQISLLDRQNADLRRDKEKAEEREEKKQAEVDRLTGIIEKQQTLLLPAPKKRGFFGLVGR